MLGFEQGRHIVLNTACRPLWRKFKGGLEW